MPTPVVIRLATVTDAQTLATHRVAMFREMGSVQPASAPALLATSEAYFAAAIPSGEYAAWIAAPRGNPGHPVAGAGVQLRSLLPRPAADGPGLSLGREGLVLNVFTDPAWRRQGIARLLMDEILTWAVTAGVVRLVLHASDDGRPLYEGLGFVATNEMRFSGPLAPSGPYVGGM